ncbi:MAG TPA: signal peptidase I [Solirubrobacteraceae bacterium]|nr:signal peptidase I [Solirubrobacteraceae bacterium]
MRPRHTRKLLSALLGVVALAAAWFYLAPQTLGGSNSYVVTHGVSMQPRFHSGDLAVVRKQGSYHVGEVVAYNSDVLHTVVLHRIIGMAGDRYVFKGDNNNFVDFEHPARSQLIGALWLHVPAVGGTLASIGSPLLVAALIGLGVLLYAGAMVRKRRRRQRHRREGARAPAIAAGAAPPPGPVLGVLLAGTVALAPFLLLALLAFTRETSQRTPYQVRYHQRGSLSYTAATTPGPAYQHGEAVTGEPLFTHVIGSAQLHFAYAFSSKEPHALAGAISLAAQLTSTSGWQRTITLARPAAFHGDRASIDATLDVGSMLALLKRVQIATAANGTYTLAVVPHVSTTGRLAGVPLRGTFAPQIRFSVEPAEIRPLVPGDGASLGTAGGHGANPLTPQAGGTVNGSRWEPLFLSLGIAKPSVAGARRVALGGIATVVIAILLALAFPFARPRSRRRGAGEEIRSRYGRLIVPVGRVRELPGVAVIDVADIESLVRIAEHYDRSILHESTPAGEAFWVTDESGQFRYAVAPEPVEADHAEVAVPEPAVAAEPLPVEAPAESHLEVRQVLMPVEPAPPADGGVDLVSFGPVGGESPPTLEQPVAPGGASPSTAAAAAFAAASRARAAGEDPWAEQVVADALEHGSADWRAACEAAGVVFTAPRPPRG